MCLCVALLLRCYQWQCPPGRWSSTTGATSCSLCPAGTLVPPPLHAPCVVGEGLMEGVSRPIPVSLHLPPEALLVHSVGCVSPCTGLFGTTPAQTSQAAACTGTCSVGRYSLAGTALSCLQCPAGTFGSTTGLTNSSCSGQCQAGYACPAASTTSTVTLCGAGTYSLAGAGACSPCPPGETVV